MTLEKLQYIATAVVSPSFKTRWLMWWNSSVHICEALYFPSKGFTDKNLEPWLNKASFWAGVFNLNSSIIVVFSVAVRRGNNC
jgi:hypothetical protein